MTRVYSVRVPLTLEHAIRRNAIRSKMAISQIARLILEHALSGNLNLTVLADTTDFLDTKLDLRFSESLISQLRAESERLSMQVSVYVRTILCAYYTKRLVFVDRNGSYVLEENNDHKANP